MQKPNILPGVYGILNVVTGRIYVGSSNKIGKRWQRHRWLLRRGDHENSYLQASWTKHGEENFAFYVIRRHVPLEDLVYSETEVLAAFQDEAEGVYNLAPPGGSNFGVYPSAETRAKRSEALKGLKRSPEARRRMSASAVGRIVSDATRAKQSAQRRGVPKSPEHRKNIGLAHLGMKRSPEARANMSAAKIGKPPTEAQLAYHASRRGQPWSPERRSRHEAKKLGLR